MKYRGIIFDLDGVICSTDHYHYLAWKALADRLGIYFDEIINNRLRGVSRMASLDIVLERYDGTLSEEEKIAAAEEKNNTYRELLKQMSPADLSPEVKDTLDKLRAKGLLLGIGLCERAGIVAVGHRHVAAGVGHVRAGDVGHAVAIASAFVGTGAGILYALAAGRIVEHHAAVGEQFPGEAGILGAAIDGQRIVALIVERAQIEAAGVVGIGLHCQQHAAEGYARLGGTVIFILVPPQADKALFQDANVCRG